MESLVGYSPWSGKEWDTIEQLSAAVQVDFLSSETLGKPKHTRVAGLPLLQGVFPTQDSNQSLLLCRWILYQLSYQGSPYMYGRTFKTEGNFIMVDVLRWFLTTYYAPYPKSLNMIAFNAK